MAKGDRNDGPVGFVVVKKEAGWTSHDVVAKLRGILRQRRTGHAGTLDPSATGVLVVGVGRATRLLRFLQTTDKSYDGSFVLGSTTSTLDSDGEVTATFEMGSITHRQVVEATASLTGEILQVPPMVSAIKIDGQRLHELARQGKEIDRPARPVRIDSFTVTEGEGEGEYHFEVECSTGTYIRSLIDDLGAALGGGAHVTSLRRTAVGPFSLNDGFTLQEIQDRVNEHQGDVVGAAILISPANGLAAMERITIGPNRLVQVARGTVFPVGDFNLVTNGPYAAVDEDQTLLGVYEQTSFGTIKPSVIVMDQGGQQ